LRAPNVTDQKKGEIVSLRGSDAKSLDGSDDSVLDAIERRVKVLKKRLLQARHAEEVVAYI
jgi:hypothetical protein